MIIYLDESKKIAKWHFIFWGFLSEHNSSYINKFVITNQVNLWIKWDIELKSTQEFWINFVENISDSIFYKNLKIKTFWLFFNGYYVDSFENYEKVLIETIKNIYPFLENYKKEINIIADKTTFKNLKKSEKKLETIINNNFKFNKKLKFRFESSKKNKSLQLADLIIWKYKEFYLFDDIYKLDDFVDLNKLNKINKNDFIRI